MTLARSADRLDSIELTELLAKYSKVSSALRRILEEVRKNNLPAVITFLDFKKAFNSIQRNEMFKILKAYGIPSRLLMAIKSMYTNTRARVVTTDGTSDEFEITTGVLQGDTLAPFLSIVVLDCALRITVDGRERELGLTLQPHRSRRHPAKALTDLDFADDIALFSNYTSQAQKLLTHVEEKCHQVGIITNEPKTKVRLRVVSSFPLGDRRESNLER